MGDIADWTGESSGDAHRVRHKATPDRSAEIVALLAVSPVRPVRWPVRRMLSFGLIVSGTIWLVIGLAIRFFIS